MVASPMIAAATTAKPAWPTGRRAARAATARSPKKTSGTHLIRTASAQAAPASCFRPDAASARAPSVSAIRMESLCPPPAKWIAKSGFQPTSAAAYGLSRASRAASSVQASTPSAASTLKIQAAAAADEPETSATPSEISVNAGP